MSHGYFHGSLLDLTGHFYTLPLIQWTTGLSTYAAIYLCCCPSWAVHLPPCLAIARRALLRVSLCSCTCCATSSYSPIRGECHQGECSGTYTTSQRNSHCYSSMCWYSSKCNFLHAFYQIYVCHYQRGHSVVWIPESNSGIAIVQVTQIFKCRST
jgi:hypothetical protein